MSGGFHPFHAGHASLYQQAKEAFPDAKVLVCATNVQSDRPFPFSLKKKLAQLSGVPPKDFIEVSRQFTIQDPALAQRIGNPDDAIVIYIRSEKDRNEAPQPWKLGPDGKPPVGKKGPKKGLPLSNYLLEYPGEGKPLEPVSKHAYMAYLKTVEFGPGITSASEIRNAWPKLNEKRKLAMVMSLYPTTKSNPKLAQNVVGMFDQVMGEQQGVAEGKITLSTDPNWYGATVDNYQATGPVVNIPANQLVGFEPDDKMNQPKSKVNVEKIVAGLKQGAKLPPLLVRKYKNGYQVLDGHHRFWAYKLLGVKSIPAQIVPDSDIEEISKQGVAEGQLNELDLFAPVTTFIKMTDGSYIQADWRKSQGNPGLSDSASFVNFKPVNPNVAKQLGLDSYQRNNSISNHRDGTIVPGGPIQGSGPLANRGYEVVDYNKPETMKELPPEIKSELIKWIQKQGVAEGLDDPWGDQGNFAGDKPVNIGGDTVKQLQVGDIVTYFGQKARIEAMSKTGNTSRITIANKMGGTTQDVLTRDLKRTGISEENGGVGGGFGTNYPGTYEQENGPFTHKGGLKLTSLTTESVDYLDEK